MIELGAALGVAMINVGESLKVPNIEGAPAIILAKRHPSNDGWMPIASTICPATTVSDLASAIAGVRSTVMLSIFAVPNATSTALTLPFTKIWVAPAT
jgi:uncharacterized integral membrane protein